MTNPTSNYGFVLPTATDLVTDLPADFEVALQGVDTRLKALQPGTTLGDLAYSSATANTNTRLAIGTAGQVLTVAAGVPSWASPSDQTPLTTKGDLFTFTTVDARLGVGANGTVLTADSAEATGLKWVATASTASSYSLLNTGGTALTGSGTITVSGITGQQKLMIVISDASAVNTSTAISVRFNTDTGSNYNNAGMYYQAQATYSINNLGAGGAMSQTSVPVFTLGSAASTGRGVVFIDGCNSTGFKAYTYAGGANADAQANAVAQIGGGVYVGTSTISSISLQTGSSNFDGGTVFVYGSAV